MGTENFKLNGVFNRKSKEYQTKPVIAAKYVSGMETGYMVYFTNQADGKRNAMKYEGVRFFDTEREALCYARSEQKQYIMENGQKIEVTVLYDAPMPVLHKLIDDTGRHAGMDFGENAFLSDESEKYDFFILEGDCWLIREFDGTVRVWYPDSGEPFFRDEYICKEVCGKKHCESVWGMCNSSDTWE